MNTPDWLKPVTLGVLIGAVAVSAVGFSWGGWVTGGNATKMANTQSRDEVIAALVPVCIDLSHTDAERVAKLEKIRETAAYQRWNALMETGWAIVPGSDSSDRDLAKACLDALELDKS